LLLYCLITLLLTFIKDWYLVSIKSYERHVCTTKLFTTCELYLKFIVL